MKALVLEKYNKFIYKDVPKPVIKPDEVLVRVKTCAICGSDIHGMDGSSGRRSPPIIMGHESAGTVERVGDKVKKYKKGYQKKNLRIRTLALMFTQRAIIIRVRTNKFILTE